MQALVVVFQQSLLPDLMGACLEWLRNEACEALINDVDSDKQVAFQRGIIGCTSGIRNFILLVAGHKSSDTNFSDLMNFGIIVKESDDGEAVK